MPLAKDLYRRMSAKNWSEWRWTFSFHDVTNWLLLRIMRGTKRLNPYFRLHEASDVLFIQPRSPSGCFLWVRYGVKTRLACTVAKAEDIQWNKMLTVCNTSRVKVGCSLTSSVL